MPDNPFRGRISRGKDPLAGVGKVLEKLPTKKRSEAKYSKTTVPGSHQTTVQQSVGTGLDLGEKQVTETTVIGTKWDIYKKFSYAIITQNDTYELPPGWDDTETSPTWDDGLPDPLDPWFKIQRIHEIGYVTEDQQIIKEKFYVPQLTWNLSSGTFNVTLEISVTVRDLYAPPANVIPPALLSSATVEQVLSDLVSEV